ncbi:Holin family protein [compost metagenome]
MNPIRDYIAHAATAAVGTTGKETMFGGIVAAAGLFFAEFLGGWDPGLKFILFAMAIDYVTGLAGAIKNKTVNSDVMFWGGIRKITVLIVIGLAVMLDEWLQPGTPVLRTIAIFFYAGREGLSIIENLGVLGVLMPAKIKEALEQIKDKGDGNNANT